jgi:hypothetical protein
VGSARALIDGIGEAGLLESLSSCESVSLALPRMQLVPATAFDEHLRIR